MKSLLIAVGVAGLLLVNSSQAQQSERVYPIFELTDEDVAMIDIKDGYIDDWEEVVGEPTLTAIELRTYPQEGLYDPADMDLRIWLAWHRATSRIYVAMERADDVFVNDFNRGGGNDTMGHNDSSIGIIVDADHSGGEYAGIAELTPEEDLLYYNYQAQWYQALAETYDSGPRVTMIYTESKAQDDWFMEPPYAEGGGRIYGEHPTISVTEFYITAFDYFVWYSQEESAISELYPGKVIGLLIFVADRDENEVMPSSFYNLGEFSDLSDTFADCVLVDPRGEIPEISAVESITWGRIKAQFVK